MNLVASVDKNWGIGFGGKILFNLKKDKEHLNNLTDNKVVVMGRKTFENLSHEKKFLKNKINICMTSSQDFSYENVDIVNDFDNLFEKISFYEKKNVFLIGGGSLYRQLLSYCEYAYITKVQSVEKADTFCPNIDKNEEWKLVETSDPYFENGVVFYFCKYKNLSVKKYNYGYEKPDLF